MIAGAVFGHMIDKSSELQGGDDSQFQGSSRRFGDSDRYYFFNTGYNRSQMVFFVGAFSMLAKLAAADGQVSDDARRKVNEFMVNDLHLSGTSYQYAQSIFNQALSQNSSFENLADQFYENFRNSPQILNLMIDIFYRVAMVDGRISANEERLIDYAVRAFHMSESVHEGIRRNHNVKGASKAYVVLGLTESATDTEIKKAYHKLILEYHPDTIASKGMASSRNMLQNGSEKSRKPTRPSAGNGESNNKQLSSQN